MSDQPLLLITGASGTIGTIYRQHLAHTNQFYALRLCDIVPPRREQLSSEWHIGNLSDVSFVHDLVKGVDTILHLGADPSPKADFYGSLLDNNIKATYNIFAAAAQAGVRKVIYASSGQSVNAYKQFEPGRQVHSGMAVRPLNMYGVSKCFGEATAAMFASSHGLKALCVRIGWFVTQTQLNEAIKFDLDNVDAVVTDRDLCHLFDCCLRTDNVDYAILHGLSNNRYPYLDLSETRALVGYAPQDDAFAIYEAVRAAAQ